MLTHFSSYKMEHCYAGKLFCWVIPPRGLQVMPPVFCNKLAQPGWIQLQYVRKTSSKTYFNALELNRFKILVIVVYYNVLLNKPLNRNPCFQIGTILNFTFRLLIKVYKKLLTNSFEVVCSRRKLIYTSLFYTNIHQKMYWRQYCKISPYNVV